MKLFSLLNNKCKIERFKQALDANYVVREIKLDLLVFFVVGDTKKKVVFSIVYSLVIFVC